MNLGNCTVWKFIKRDSETCIWWLRGLNLPLLSSCFFFWASFFPFLPNTRKLSGSFLLQNCVTLSSNRCIALLHSLEGPLNHRDLKWRPQVIMILKKMKIIIQRSCHSLIMGVLKISCLRSFLPAIFLSLLNQCICRITWISPIFLRENQLVLSQCLLVKSTMSQSFKLQLLLFLRLSCSGSPCTSQACALESEPLPP